MKKNVDFPSRTQWNTIVYSNIELHLQLRMHTRALLYLLLLSWINMIQSDGGPSRMNDYFCPLCYSEPTDDVSSYKDVVVVTYNVGYLPYPLTFIPKDNCHMTIYTAVVEDNLDISVIKSSTFKCTDVTKRTHKISFDVTLYAPQDNWPTSPQIPANEWGEYTELLAEYNLNVISGFTTLECTWKIPSLNPSVIPLVVNATVKAFPEVVIEATRDDVYISNELTLTCGAYHFNVSSIRWFYNDNQVGEFGVLGITYFGCLYKYRDVEYHIPFVLDVNYEDKQVTTGTYKCEITSDTKKTYSGVYQLQTEECESGSYGRNCSETCECLDNGICDPVTGNCTCIADWHGKYCKVEVANQSNMIGVITGVILAAFIAVLVIIIVLKRRKPNGSVYTSASVRLMMLENIAKTDNESVDDAMIQDITKWIIKASELDIGDKIGEGGFGEVYKAQYKKLEVKEINVAVKMLKSSTSRTEEKALLTEAYNHIKLGVHPNIVNLHGIVVDSGALQLVVEFAKGGDLLAHLQRLELQKTVMDMPKEGEFLMTLAIHVAQGLEFLHHKQVIHRDIAARNVVIYGDGIGKICDLGLSRDVYQSIYRRPPCPQDDEQDIRLPIRWMAPETLEGDFVYSHKSDMWSFGVLLWEISSLGCRPFKDVKAEHIMAIIKTEKQRLKKYPECPDELYNLMISCWQEEAKNRPPAAVMVKQLKRLQSQQKDFVIINYNGGNLYYGLYSIIPTDNSRGGARRYMYILVMLLERAADCRFKVKHPLKGQFCRNVGISDNCNSCPRGKYGTQCTTLVTVSMVLLATVSMEHVCVPPDRGVYHVTEVLKDSSITSFDLIENVSIFLRQCNLEDLLYHIPFVSDVNYRDREITTDNYTCEITSDQGQIYSGIYELQTEECPPGMWGPVCEWNCACSVNSSCERDSGCLCFAGLMGNTCDTVCVGSYGRNCSETCECLNNGICDPVTGNCTCKDGWEGDDCGSTPPPPFQIGESSKELIIAGIVIGVIAALVVILVVIIVPLKRRQLKGSAYSSASDRLLMLENRMADNDSFDDVMIEDFTKWIVKASELDIGTAVTSSAICVSVITAKVNNVLGTADLISLTVVESLVFTAVIVVVFIGILVGTDMSSGVCVISEIVDPLVNDFFVNFHVTLSLEYALLPRAGVHSFVIVVMEMEGFRRSTPFMILLLAIFCIQVLKSQDPCAYGDLYGRSLVFESAANNFVMLRTSSDDITEFTICMWIRVGENDTLAIRTTNHPTPTSYETTKDSSVNTTIEDVSSKSDAEMPKRTPQTTGPPTKALIGADKQASNGKLTQALSGYWMKASTGASVNASMGNLMKSPLKTPTSPTNALVRTPMKTSPHTHTEASPGTHTDAPIRTLKRSSPRTPTETYRASMEASIRTVIDSITTTPKTPTKSPLELSMKESIGTVIESSPTTPTKSPSRVSMEESIGTIIESSPTTPTKSPSRASMKESIGTVIESSPTTPTKSPPKVLMKESIGTVIESSPTTPTKSPSRALMKESIGTVIESSPATPTKSPSRAFDERINWNCYRIITYNTYKITI
uniref:Uncharacterized protein LOC102803455 n=1 Tax=Saccoglossus kowalevskii TaxID=10224 RepID=A0ABM0MFE5_SACKO|nr:PREDICTED: uncharacterized protein LOC102803455 [Saccoglossus kowalevskii]